MTVQPERTCNIYRCSLKEGMYLYLDHNSILDDLPDALKKKIGQPELSMTLAITANTKLANAKAEAILDAIETQGFYLQIPVNPIDYMQEVNKANHFLSKEPI
ncbi:MAG: YcgL domain-containing protein [Thiotrichales bacterium]|nr:YcgL domain-containing protein [Thiotrichales bacterium]